ncbi:cytochrome b [Porticoccus sp. W117]|uniref:cytochrome b n=1 Tax=Porticoccus sp. W117 TaxID=3054777 RepID=UPI002597DA29|nr:cytochrome b [Porticoccus sp. W117]MDM3872555.1 cytochrome b [Porticoccus sp. W117]
MIKNSEHSYGLVAKLMHWLMALAVIGLFALGLYMVELDYYDRLYRTLPHIHKSIGILLFAVLIGRLLWRRFNPQPKPQGSPAERRIAHWVHMALYLLMVAIMVSGYLISTADGRAIEVFNWFEVPATLADIDGQEDIAGDIHEWLAWTLIALVALHALAALKHHFIDKDNTLKRMTFFKGE